MLTLAEKIIGARSILGWNQQEMAEFSAVSEGTIKNIETGKDVGGKTEAKILRALSLAGLEIGYDTIRKPDTTLTRFEGEDWFLDVLDDVYLTLQTAKKKELLIMNGDNRVSPPAVYEAFKRIRESGVTIREMVEEGNTFMHGPESDYRWIPSAHFKNYVTMIYDDKILTDLQTHGVLFKNTERAEADRRNFNLIWSLLPPLDVQSTADVRY